MLWEEEEEEEREQGIPFDFDFLSLLSKPKVTNPHAFLQSVFHENVGRVSSRAMISRPIYFHFLRVCLDGERIFFYFPQFSPHPNEPLGHVCARHFIFVFPL